MAATIRVVVRQYAIIISLIFGASFFIIEYTISSITMINYYHQDNNDGRVAIIQGRREWNFITASPRPEMNDEHHQQQQQQQRAPDNFLDAHPWPWARDYLLPIINNNTATTTVIHPQQPTTTTTTTEFIFWHIPKSGGTSAKAIYRCLLGKSVSILSSRAHILKARDKKNKEKKKSFLSFLGFASSPSSFTSSLKSSSSSSSADFERRRRSNNNNNNKNSAAATTAPNLIFSMLPDVVATNLFHPNNKGRLLTLFRHPLERLISKFYYLQIADWEKGYKPHWKNKSLLTWAATINNDNEHMVRTLAGKHAGDLVTELDLRRAQETIRRYAVVGLTDQMEESVRRFNLVMGIPTNNVVGEEDDDDGARRARCMNEFFGGLVRDDVVGEKAADDRDGGMKKLNSNPHPVVIKGDLEWDILAEKNKLDIQLYDYIVRLFDEQKDIINKAYNSDSNPT